MRNLFAKMWNDDRGNVGFEYLALVTIVGLGLIVGFATVRNALVAEYTELSSAILNLSQEYSYCGISACCASQEGSATTDAPGTADFTRVNLVGTDINEIACP